MDFNAEINDRWQAVTLRAVSNASRTNGQKLSIHNYTHGTNTMNGKFLNPASAVQAIQAKFEDLSDPNIPTGEAEVVFLMIAENSADEFLSKAETVASITGDSVLKQGADYIRSQIDLNQTKMIKTPIILAPNFGAIADITPAASRAMLKNQTATDQGGGDLVKKLDALKKIKAKREEEQRQQRLKLMSSNTEIYAFLSRGTLSEIAPKLSQNLPNQGAIFTALICYVGQNLGAIAQMVELKND